MILKAVDAAKPPLHLPLGPIAHAIAEETCLLQKGPRRLARHRHRHRLLVIARRKGRDVITMYVTYAGDAGTNFDRDDWINVHLPLVRGAWEPTVC